MTRRFKRTKNFDASLEIKNSSFIAPPRDAQRRWLLTRALNEFASDVNALDGLARRFVPGSEGVPLQDRSQALLDEEEIMEDWQRPIMRAMAAIVAESHGDVLEIGFGRGIAASDVQELGVRSHTIIECNDAIAGRFETWRGHRPGQDIRLVHGMWQDTIASLGMFDAVLFHTYPLTEDECIEYIVESTTFAEHFFPAAAAHVKPGGVFTYMTNEIDSLSRAHQRALLRHFDSFSLRILHDLELPSDVKDAWWADSIAIVSAAKNW